MALPVYNINGENYSQEDTLAAAAEQGMSLDNYVKLSKATIIEGKITDSTVTVDPDVESEDTDLISENISLDFLAPIQGIKFDKETQSYVQGDGEANLFKQDEEEVVKTLSELYAGTGLVFEEDNFNKLSPEEYGTERGDRNIKMDPFTFNMFDVAKVSIPNVDETIQLQLDSDDPGIHAINLKRLEDYAKKYESYLNAPAETTDLKKYRAWEKDNKIVINAEKDATNKYLKDEKLFDQYEKVQRTQVLTSPLPTAAAPPMAITTETVIVKPYEKQLIATSAAIKKMYPNLSDDELEANTKRVVRNQLYQADVNEAKYVAREAAIDQGVMTQEEMYAASYFISVKEGAKYNEATKKIELLAEEKLKTNAIISILNKPNFSEEDNNAVIQWGSENDIWIDPNPEMVTLKNGQVVPSSFVDVANQVNIKVQAQEMLYSNVSNQQDLALGELDDAQLTSEAAGKNYELHEKYLTNIGLGSLDLAMGGAHLIGSAATGIYALADGGEAYNDLQKLGGEYSQYSQQVRQEFVRDVAFRDGFSSAGNFGKFLMQEVSNQIPILAAMALSGGTAAPYVIGATSAGSQMMDMQSEIAMGLEINPGEGPKYSQTEVWLKSIGYGGAEGLFAGLTTVPILKRANTAWLNAGKDQLLKNNLKAFVSSYSKRGIIYEGLLESAGEVATSGAQNLITGRPFTEGMDHAGFSGFGFGLLFAGVPFFKGAYNARFSSFEKLATARKLQDDINDLGRRYETAQTDGARAAIVELIESKSQDLASEISKQEDLINNNLTSRGAQYVLQNINQQADLQRQAQTIQNTEGLAPEVKKAKIKELQEKFDKLVAIKNRAVQSGAMLKNETEWNAFEGQDPDSYNEYIETATSQLYGEKGGKESSEKDIDNRAYDLYYGDIVRSENAKQKTNNGAFEKDFVSFDTVEQAEAYVESRVDLTTEQKAKINQGLKRGNDGVAVEGTADSKPLTLAVVENQVANQRKYTRTHEVGHQAFWSIFANQKNNGAFEAISNQLLETLKSTDSKVYNELLADSIYDKDGNLDPAEVISKVLEYVAGEKITNVKKRKGIAGLFGTMTQQKFGSEFDFDFRGEQDMFNFVVGMARKINSGELSKADIAKARESALVKKFEAIEGTKATNESETKIAASLTPLQEINGLVPPSVETQEQYFARNIFNPVFAATQPNGVISNYIKSKSPSKEVGEKAIKNIQDRLLNYDPAALRKKSGNKAPITFGEFIFANTNFIKLDAKKALFKESEAEKKTTDLDTKEAQGKIAEDDAIKKDRRRFRKIIDSGVLPGFTIKEIGNKLTKIVKVLKSRLDTKVSINKTVSPLIAEIKKEIGKQADIDLKEAMGGKKDGKLQKWLLKNKKAVLENMTTTWLSGAIPKAVQKSVGGSYVVDIDGKRVKDSYGDFTFTPNYTSDWKGKDIDREKTSSNKSGKTSGGELVRRLPNVATTLSDVDYLESMLDNVVENAEGEITSGNPIRGRKESMAKAIAEEIGLEIFNKELLNENSDISKAFENNQAAKKVVLSDMFVEEIATQSERGQIKFSEVPTLQSMFNLTIEGDTGAVDTLYNSLSDDAKAIWENIGTQLEGGSQGYKKGLKVWKDAPNAVKGILADYFKNNSKRDNKTAMKQLDVFSNKLIDNLPNSLVQALGFDFFGAHFRYLNTKEGTKGGDIKEKIKNLEADGIDLDFNPSDITIVQAGFGLVDKITKDVLNKQFDTVQDKIDYFNENYKDEVDNLNIANKQAAQAVLEAAFDIIAKDPKQAVGFLRLLESTTNIGKSLRGLTGISDIQFYAESQAVYINAETGSTYTNTLTKPQQKLFKDGVIVINENHPNYKDAVKAIKDGSKQSLAQLLRVKGEHATPDAKKKLAIAKILLDYVAISINNPSQVDIVKNAFAAKLKVELQNFDQQLNTKVLSDIQDSKLGATSDIGDARLTVIPKESLLAFYDMTGLQTAGRVKRAFDEMFTPAKIEKLAEIEAGQKAINDARTIAFSENPKKIRVFDFDDTLARTKSNVLYTMPDGTKGKIDAATFAKDAANMEADGAQWDFSEFSKVMNGSAGPLLDVAKIIADKRGTKDVFVLTARPADAAGPIQEFLASMGLNIPIENITGLGNGTPKAKADWVINKVAEGYNDFYFADDHTGNVKAVKDALNTFDVKGKVQLAKVAFSESLDSKFNRMIERNKGVNAKAEFSDVIAKRRGANIGRFKLWMPSSLNDFKGLTSYTFAGKGRQGDADQKFFQDALITPYFRGIAAIESARQTIKNEFRELNKKFKPVVKKLGKMAGDTGYTNDQAIRVYLWNKAGHDIPGLSKRDNKKLNDFVAADPELSGYADAALLLSKKGKWNKPSEYWDAETILSDLNNLTEKTNRKEFIAEFIENADIIFSDKNLNKIEATYGTKQREAIEDILYRMKNGTNRASGMNKNVNSWNNWVNNSIGSIMFFNRRSALLQTLSTVNFINWGDNNVLKAALAFANQPQYWKDFAMIFNSDKLKQRRSGLKSDVNEAEIANAVKGAKNKATAALSYLLKIGFTPTQLADSFAIAAGGATFYRNRVKSLMQKGMSKAEAEAKAFEDFSQIAEETQQSGDPALISSDQASSLGRLVLAFQNTPIQLNRSIKKAAQDIYNRRRTPGQTQLQSDFSNMSKIIYYGAIQNLIFTALQNGLFALIPGFDDEEYTDDQKAKKENVTTTRMLNSTIDTTLKGGFGLPGAVVATLKNVIMEYHKQEDKGFTADHTYTILQLANLSPPIGSKLGKVYKGIQTNRFDKSVIEKRGWDITIDGKFNLSPKYNVIGNYVEGSTNIPLARITDELNSITEAFDTRNTIWQRIALGTGWKGWNVGANNEEHDLIKVEAKAQKKIDNKIKAKEKREQDKKDEAERVRNLTEKEKAIELAVKKRKRAEASRKGQETKKKNQRERQRVIDSVIQSNRNKIKK